MFPDSRKFRPVRSAQSDPVAHFGAFAQIEVNQRHHAAAFVRLRTAAWNGLGGECESTFGVLKESDMNRGE